MKLLLSAVLMFVMLFQSDGKFDKNTCTCKGKKLQGRVKVVTSFPDFKVRAVEVFPDLKVKVRNRNFEVKDCGDWVFVEDFPDFTIRYVDAFPDFTIKMTSY
jgi:hypothetical protein